MISNHSLMWHHAVNSEMVQPVTLKVTVQLFKSLLECPSFWEEQAEGSDEIQPMS